MSCPFQAGSHLHAKCGRAALVDTLTLSSEVFPYAQESPAVFT